MEDVCQRRAARFITRRGLLRLRYWVIRRIEHETGLGRKIHAGRRKNIDEPRRTLPHVLGGVNHPRRNDEHRGTVIVLMLVVAPTRLVR